MMTTRKIKVLGRKEWNNDNSSNSKRLFNRVIEKAFRRTKHQDINEGLGELKAQAEEQQLIAEQETTLCDWYDAEYAYRDYSDYDIEPFDVPNFDPFYGFGCDDHSCFAALIEMSNQ